MLLKYTIEVTYFGQASNSNYLLLTDDEYHVFESSLEDAVD